MICRCKGEEDAQGQCEPGKGLVKGWGNKDQHQGQESAEGDPVGNDECRRMNDEFGSTLDLFDHPICKSCDPID